MKTTIEIDCTPEEARRLAGLPDVTKVNEAYVDNLTKLVQGGASIEQLSQLGQLISPLGNAGLNLVQQLMQVGTGAVLNATRKEK
ncbi:DUF6489 family protein [uncultured Dechloromonas sp.]|uniref:DUF6489 family protein n=1 Tax=uncultured Dechloromonas sp. TaxID=171719 RepID=UPI0025E89A38|nr:DUF6489 family protein [uncultured Dechloromonas sp.]